MKPEITTLFIDIGGVLLNNGSGRDFRYQAAERFHLDQHKLDERHSILFETYEEGYLSLDEYLAHVVFHQKRDFTPNEFCDFMFSLTTPFAVMMALIKSLKLQYGLKIVAVNNEARDLNAYRIDKFELNSFIDFFVSPCYVHIRKPDNRIFELALDLAKVAQDEIGTIGDVQLFVDVATGLGIKSVFHTNYLSTLRDIAVLGLPIKPENKVYA